MFTDVYIGLVKSEDFDYYKEGNLNGYQPKMVLESMRVGNKPALAGERDLYWDILDHANAKKTDWGCWVVKMTREEMLDYLNQEKYTSNPYAQFLATEIRDYLIPGQDYLLTAVET